MEVTINSHMSARGFLQNMPLSLVACVAIAACFARAQLRRQHCLVAGAAATLLLTTLVWARAPSFSAILPRQRWATASSSSLAQQLPRLLRVQWPQMADWLLFKPEIIGEASKIIIFLSQQQQLRYYIVEPPGGVLQQHISPPSYLLAASKMQLSSSQFIDGIMLFFRWRVFFLERVDFLSKFLDVFSATKTGK